MKISYFVSW